MTDWFRSWHGAPSDSKWLVIGRKAGVPRSIVIAVWYSLQDYASQHALRGTVAGFDVETCAEFLECGQEQVAAVIAALTEKGTIIKGRLAAWEKRQPRREEVLDDDAVRGGRRRVRRTPVIAVNAASAAAPAVTAPEEIQIQSSEASASAPAVAAPMDERTILFREGLATVVRVTGRNERQCRALIGNWLKAANDDCRALNRLIEDAETANPIDVVAWIEGHFRSRGPPGREPNMAALSAQIMGKLNGSDQSSGIRAAGVGEPGPGTGDRRDGERSGHGQRRGPPVAGQGTAAGGSENGGGKVIDLVAEPRRGG